LVKPKQDVHVQQDHWSASHWSSIGETMSPLDLDQTPMHAEKGVRSALQRSELSNRSTILGDHERLARPLDLIHELQALGLELGGLNRLHRVTIVVTMDTTI
jgi:hypothetical protein